MKKANLHPDPEVMIAMIVEGKLIEDRDQNPTVEIDIIKSTVEEAMVEMAEEEVADQEKIDTRGRVVDREIEVETETEEAIEGIEIGLTGKPEEVIEIEMEIEIDVIEEEMTRMIFHPKY